jgi:hypothetical protein
VAYAVFAPICHGPNSGDVNSPETALAVEPDLSLCFQLVQCLRDTLAPAPANDLAELDVGWHRLTRSGATLQHFQDLRH